MSDSSFSSLLTSSVNGSNDLRSVASWHVNVVESWYVWVAALVVIAAGVMSSFAAKLQNRSPYPICGNATCPMMYFEQPFWQSFLMFSGEALCLVVYWTDQYIRKRSGRLLLWLEFPQTSGSFNKPKCPYYWWALPSLLDMIASTSLFIAMTMVQASTVTMLRNGMLICTSILSVSVLRKPLRIHELVGILLLTIGMVSTSIQSIMQPETATNTNPDDAWLGIVITLAATVFQSLQVILEEWFLRKTYLPPMLCMGLEGSFGMVYGVLGIVVSHYLGLVNFSIGWYQMNSNGLMVFTNIWFLVTICIYNGAGICVTKLGSGLLRAVTFSVKAPVIWLVELIVGWSHYSHFQLAALILTFVGFFFYASILPARGSGFYEFTRYQIPCFCTRPARDTHVNISKVEPSNDPSTRLTTEISLLEPV